MLLTKFDPLDTFIEDFNKKFTPKNVFNDGLKNFTPCVNTREGKFAYHIEADLPGISKKDIDVSIDNNMLTFCGERKTKDETKKEDYYKIETSFGKFSRSFTLPENIDMENIEANCENGVLEITIPKLKKASKTKKRVEIK